MFRIIISNNNKCNLNKSFPFDLPTLNYLFEKLSYLINICVLKWIGFKDKHIFCKNKQSKYEQSNIYEIVSSTTWLRRFHRQHWMGKISMLKMQHGIFTLWRYFFSFTMWYNAIIWKWSLKQASYEVSLFFFQTNNYLTKRRFK